MIFFSCIVLKVFFFCSFIYGSNIEKNKNCDFAVKFYEIKYESIGLDGKYSETFVEQTSEVVNQYFRSNSLTLYQTPPLNNNIFSLIMDCIYLS